MKNNMKKSSPDDNNVCFHDFEPEQSDFLNDVIQGLSQPQKTLLPKYFYDQRGSELFDEICQQPEYYATRTEISILQNNANDIARLIGPDCVLIELGSGVSKKIRCLFDALSPASYLGIDISKDFLLLSTKRLARDYPDLEVHAVCADFTQKIELPEQCRSDRLVAFFPGSSIGNFEPDDAITLLKDVASMVGKGGKMLIGVDLKKDHAVLNAAYNDANGITANFNLNLLQRMREELQVDIDASQFDHHAFYNNEKGRIEMHLVSQCDQEIIVGCETFQLTRNEKLHTENSYKYNLRDFKAIAEKAGFQVEQVWLDPKELFSVQCLVVK
jgi:dimethylhistidine N-methyltransferase